MSSTVKGTIIITNHFTREPVVPKIVYANTHLLATLGCGLDDILDRDPSEVFLNWHLDDFISQIIDCVENKKIWQGCIDLNTANGPLKKHFTISPVFDNQAEISYYNCSTDLLSDVAVTEQPLDRFIACLNDGLDHYKNVCDQSPSALIQMDLNGTITYSNTKAIDMLQLAQGSNFWEIVDDVKEQEIKGQVLCHQSIARVKVMTVPVIAQGTPMVLRARFWPTVNAFNIITGYSFSLVDNTFNYGIAKEFEALKG